MPTTIQPGAKIGKWTVIEPVPVPDTHRKWLCRCECGRERQVYHHNLANGQSTQCRHCSKSNPMMNLTYARTHAEIGVILGITRQAVAQIEHRAMRKVEMRFREIMRDEMEFLRA